MNQEDATTLLIRFLRDPDHGDFGIHGYDIDLPALIKTYLRKKGIQHFEADQKLREMIPYFYAAAWELCRRGIIRPGVNSYLAQATAAGNAGDGYSITPFGKRWLDESDCDDFVPTEPGRFAEMLEPFKEKYGSGFYERAQEAIRCYGAHAYLACCAMCGAAAESIMLAAAIAKKGDEKNILKTYATANGRQRVENIVIGQANEHIKREFRGLTELLKYWRDEAGHGKASQISDNEAYTSIAMLLRYAMFVNENWNDLTI